MVETIRRDIIKYKNGKWGFRHKCGNYKNTTKYYDTFIDAFNTARSGDCSSGKINVFFMGVKLQ